MAIGVQLIFNFQIAYGLIYRLVNRIDNFNDVYEKNNFKKNCNGAVGPVEPMGLKVSKN